MKKYFLLLISMLIFSLVVLQVNATNLPNVVTMSTPTTSGTIGSVAYVNVSIEPSLNIDACAIFLKSTSTANSSFVKLINISNATSLNHPANSSETGDFNGTVRYEDIIIEPSSDYQLKALCYGHNDSGSGNMTAESTTVTLVTVDRADIPVVPTTSHTAETEFDDIITKTITYTVVGANTTGCRIAFLLDGASPRFTGTNTFAMTHSSNSCTYTVTKAAVPDGTYDVYTRASDGTNTSISTKINFKIKTTEGDVGGGGISGFGDGQVDIAVAKGVISKEWQNFIILIVIFGGAWWFFNHSSKKR